jgi:hypothetical protein
MNDRSIAYLSMEMGKESMAQCPMMKDMKSTDDKSAGDHKRTPARTEMIVEWHDVRRRQIATDLWRYFK